MTPYKTREFAALAGVTVKALRHYERLGLLKPRRTGAGHRRYIHDDLGRLRWQIEAIHWMPYDRIKRVADFLDTVAAVTP